MASFRNGSRKPYSRPSEDGGKWLHDRAPDATVSFNGRNRLSHPSGSAKTSKLVVSNLHYEITKEELIKVFGVVGTLVKEPIIRYDRSGRSTGVATITYETPLEATNAKKKYDGLTAKGQPMSIEYDDGPQPKSIRSASAPTTGKLLSRIEKPGLLDRLGVDEPASKSNGPGPIRSKPRRGRGGAGAASRLPRSKPASSKMMSAEDLDKELDSFMGDSSVATQDVEMS